MVLYAKPIMFRMTRRVSRKNTRLWLRRLWISLWNIYMLYYKYIAEHMGTFMLQVTLTLSTIDVIWIFRSGLPATLCRVVTFSRRASAWTLGSGRRAMFGRGELNLKTIKFIIQLGLARHEASQSQSLPPGLSSVTGVCPPNTSSCYHFKVQNLHNCRAWWIIINLQCSYEYNTTASCLLAPPTILKLCLIFLILDHCVVSVVNKY